MQLTTITACVFTMAPRSRANGRDRVTLLPRARVSDTARASIPSLAWPHGAPEAGNPACAPAIRFVSPHVASRHGASSLRTTAICVLPSNFPEVFRDRGDLDQGMPRVGGFCRV